MFRQQLPSDAETARAQRRADGHLLLTVRSSRQQQVGHVDARNQQHADNRAKKDQQREPHVLHHLLARWNDSDTDVGIGSRKLLTKYRGNLPDLRLGLFERDAGLQTADDVEQSRASILREILELLASERRPHVDGFGQNRKLKSLRHDAHDRVALPAERQRAADDLGIGTEAGAPQPVADDDESSLDAIRFDLKGAAKRWRHAQQPEEIAVDDRRLHPHRVAVSDERHVVQKPRSESLERLRLAPIEKVRERHPLPHRASRIRRPDVDEAIRTPEGQRLEQCLVDDAEDRGVRADADGQCDRSHGRRAAVDPEVPERVAQIVNYGRHDRPPVHPRNDNKRATRCPPP